MFVLFSGHLCLSIWVRLCSPGWFLNAFVSPERSKDLPLSISGKTEICLPLETGFGSMALCSPEGPP